MNECDSYDVICFEILIIASVSMLPLMRIHLGQVMSHLGLTGMSQMNLWVAIYYLGGEIR